MFSLDGYWALRTAAGVVKHSDRGVLSVTGRDRATWLQGLVTNDVLALTEGQSCYAAYLTPQGRMITDMTVIALHDRLLLVVPASRAVSLRDRLDGLIFAEDAQVRDESAAIVVWGVYGPGAQATLKGRLHSEGEGGANPGRGNPGGSSGGNPLGLPDSSYGVPGFTLYLDRDQTLPAGMADLPAVSLDTLDVVRIEAGTPKFLVDMDENTIPLEAGIEDRAISFTKGCYVGQEVIVRVTHRGGGRVAKKLVRFKVSDEATLKGSLHGQATLKGHLHILSGDRDIGRVTSAAFSPAQNATVGLGYVHRDFVEPGTQVGIVSNDKRLGATIT